MSRNKETALLAFEDEKAAILAMLRNIPQQLQDYDREISSSPGGFSDWGHAGTLADIRQKLGQIVTQLGDARRATRGRTDRRAQMAAKIAEAYTGHAFNSRGRRVRVIVPTK